MNAERLVGTGHQPAPNTSLPFVHTARHYSQLIVGVRRPDACRACVLAHRPVAESPRTSVIGGRTSRNTVFVGEPADGSIDDALACRRGTRSMAIARALARAAARRESNDSRASIPHRRLGVGAACVECASLARRASTFRAAALARSVRGDGPARRPESGPSVARSCVEPAPRATSTSSRRSRRCVVDPRDGHRCRRAVGVRVERLGLRRRDATRRTLCRCASPTRRARHRFDGLVRTIRENPEARVSGASLHDKHPRVRVERARPRDTAVAASAKLRIRNGGSLGSRAEEGRSKMRKWAGPANVRNAFYPNAHAATSSLVVVRPRELHTTDRATRAHTRRRRSIAVRLAVVRTSNDRTAPTERSRVRRPLGSEASVSTRASNSSPLEWTPVAPRAPARPRERDSRVATQLVPCALRVRDTLPSS